MIDINKLNKMLDDALALESVESLNLWMEEQIKADREAGIIRECRIWNFCIQWKWRLH